MVKVRGTNTSNVNAEDLYFYKMTEGLEPKKKEKPKLTREERNRLYYQKNKKYLDSKTKAYRAKKKKEKEDEVHT